MTLIATINGTEVHSDKQYASIRDTRVDFTDGSWCDVSTGKVHNVGRGYISLGSGTTSSERVTKRPERVEASAFEVRGVSADVTVSVHREPFIEFVISGPEDQVNDIRTNVSGGTLVMVANQPATGGHTVVQSGRGRKIGFGSNNISVSGNIVITGSATVITSGNGKNQVQVDVKVPQGTAVNAYHVLGTVTVGDIDAPLIASTQGHRVYAGRVTDVQLTVQGSGDISVGEVNGDAAVTVQGSGDVEISRGAVRSLSATVQGSGDISVDTSAHTARLTVMGSGDIRVAHVDETPVETVAGSGDIKVRRVG